MTDIVRACVSELLSIGELSHDARTRAMIQARCGALLKERPLEPETDAPQGHPWKLSDDSIVEAMEALKALNVKA